MHDSVVLWTRITTQGADDIEVTWEIARDLEMTEVVASGVTLARASRDHTVKVIPEGLAGHTTYFYRFTVEQDGLRFPSLIGRTITAPAPGQAVERLRFGVTSCCGWRATGVLNGYRKLAERDLDAIFNLGDYYYEYGGVHDLPDHEIYRLEDYRTRHAQYKSAGDLQRAHQLHPWIVIWDDHESSNNSWFGGANNHSRDGSDPNDKPNPDSEGEPVDEGDWFERKAAAQQAYNEWMPIRGTDPAVIYRKLAYGDLLDIVMLDTRLEGRSLQANATDVTDAGSAEGIQSIIEDAADGQLGDPGNEILGIDAQVNDPDRTMISETQREWLFDSLDSSTATWKLIGNQVMMSQLKLVNIPETVAQALLIPTGDEPSLGFVQSGGVYLANDLWDGYNAERVRVFTHIKDAGFNNVVVITGDIHSSWANDLYIDPFIDQAATIAGVDQHVGVEFVTPGITSGGFGEQEGPFLEAAVPAQNPGTRWVDLTQRGYMVLDVTQERVQADWFHHNGFGEISEQDNHGASWFTENGNNRLKETSAPASVADTRPRPDGPGPGFAQPPEAEVTPARESEEASSSGSGTMSLAGLGAIAGAVLLKRRLKLASKGKP